MVICCNTVQLFLAPDDAQKQSIPYLWYAGGMAGTSSFAARKTSRLITRPAQAMHRPLFPLNLFYSACNPCFQFLNSYISHSHNLLPNPLNHDPYSLECSCRTLLAPNPLVHAFQGAENNACRSLDVLGVLLGDAPEHGDKLVGMPAEEPAADAVAEGVLVGW